MELLIINVCIIIKKCVHQDIAPIVDRGFLLGYRSPPVFGPSVVDIRIGAVEGNATQCKGKAPVVMCMKFD